ncbi:MAG: rod shape-determining protein MreD [Longimicrobiales bacterium]|nr:rod shape-determining protein MreD [Longimicrobiales bacterium]
MSDGWGFWVFIGVLVAAHFGLHLSLGIEAAAPDLLTIAVLLAARELPGGPAAGVGFALGILEDAVSLGAFGAAAVTLTLVGYVGARSRDLFVGDSAFFLGSYLFLGAWIQDLLYFSLAGGVRRGEPVDALLVTAPLEALYAALIGLVAVVLYRTVR